jgi:3-isopropylmalate/(R)-2-methylmalate dehydratase large subunit
MMNCCKPILNIEKRWRTNVKPKNIVDKIWDDHVVCQKEGHPAVFAIDFTLLHEVTCAQAFEMLREKNIPVVNTKNILATIDHSVPTSIDRHHIKDSIARNQIDRLRQNAREHEILFYDFDSAHQGIVHVVGPELGLTQPGMTIVCGDSHTSTHGAFGAMAFGIGTSELAYVLGTGCLLLTKPKVMKVQFTGSLRKGVFAKDIIMKLIAQIGMSGANSYVLEYSGPVIENMTMEERMTICNMSIECGARAGLICPDEITFQYLQNKSFAPGEAQWQRAINHWKSYQSDPGCHYDAYIVIDVSELTPMVTWGTNPAQAIAIRERIPALPAEIDDQYVMAKNALHYMRLQPQMAMDLVIDWAFVGSCTNARIEDLRIVAAILRNQKIHPNVTFMIVPGSEQVLAAARREGLDIIFEQAGANFRMPGCSMCLGMNEDKVPPFKRCISSSNRNFVGRQGPNSFTHLASPATVAASAIVGKITSPENYLEE